MAIHTIKAAAELVGLSQNTIFKHLKAGKLSRSHTGKGVDSSELLRVYGSFKGVEKVANGGVRDVIQGDVDDTQPITSPDTNQRVIELLQAQVKDLQDRANKADSREERLMKLLEAKLLQDDSDSTLKRFKFW